MFDAGMRVHRDKFGNIIGRIDGEGPAIVTGSHTDTVATAGKYDGVLGVLAVLKCRQTEGFSDSSPRSGNFP